MKNLIVAVGMHDADSIPTECRTSATEVSP